MPGEAKSVKRFERSNGLDTALYKNYLYLFLSDILCRTECGCTMGGRMINHLMYADDLVILSTSAKGLQRLVDIQLYVLPMAIYMT